MANAVWVANQRRHGGEHQPQRRQQQRRRRVGEHAPPCTQWHAAGRLSAQDGGRPLDRTFGVRCVPHQARDPSCRFGQLVPGRMGFVIGSYHRPRKCG